MVFRASELRVVRRRPRYAHYAPSHASLPLCLERNRCHAGMSATRQPRIWGLPPTYAGPGASATETSPLYSAAARIGHRHSQLISMRTVTCPPTPRKQRRFCTWSTRRRNASWVDILQGKNCSDDSFPDAQPNYGGARRKPIMLQIDTPVPVYHTVAPTAALYNDTLWLGIDPSPQATSTSLWLLPGSTMLLSDHVDLAITLGYPVRFGVWPGIVKLMRIAAANLTNIDSILFTHHFDGNGAQCIKEHLRGCCRLVPEFAVLHDWHPLRCPGHPRLREGVVPHQCSCTIPQAIGWGRERDALLQNKKLGPREARTYFC